MVEEAMLVWLSIDIMNGKDENKSVVSQVPVYWINDKDAEEGNCKCAVELDYLPS